MNKCLHCGVNILDQTDVCPLCQCVVEQENDSEAKERYPDIRLKGRRLELVSRIALFLAIVLGAVAVIMNYVMDSDMWWSMIVVGALAYLMLFFLFLHFSNLIYQQINSLVEKCSFCFLFRALYCI